MLCTTALALLLPSLEKGCLVDDVILVLCPRPQGFASRTVHRGKAA
jgi:hypothetical protein